ncbi:MAG: hypothetical protein ABEN55_07290 [Bradymonadaceae bacterium]
MAEKFTKHGIADQVSLRLHPEHNGDWQGYAGGNEKKFKQAWRQFAEQHDLPIAFMEWGLKNKNKWSGGDNPRFIRVMYEWMVDHNVHFQTEFEAKGKDWHLSSGNVPDSLSAYQDTFKSGAPRDYIAESRSGSDACGGDDQKQKSDNHVFVTEKQLKRQK